MVLLMVRVPLVASMRSDRPMAGSVGVRRLRAVVPNLEDQRVVVNAHHHVGTGRVGMLGDVRECLRDKKYAVVSMSRGRRGAVSCSRTGMARSAIIDSRPMRSPPLLSETGRMPVHEITQLGAGALRVIERLADEVRRRTALGDVCRASLRVMIVWTVGCCAPSCTSRWSRRRVSSAVATTLALDAVS